MATNSTTPWVFCNSALSGCRVASTHCQLMAILYTVNTTLHHTINCVDIRLPSIDIEAQILTCSVDVKTWVSDCSHHVRLRSICTRFQSASCCLQCADTDLWYQEATLILRWWILVLRSSVRLLYIKLTLHHYIKILQSGDTIQHADI